MTVGRTHTKGIYSSSPDYQTWIETNRFSVYEYLKPIVYPFKSVYTRFIRECQETSVIYEGKYNTEQLLIKVPESNVSFYCVD